jgi:Putative peptidoglycan binding domain
MRGKGAAHRGGRFLMHDQIRARCSHRTSPAMTFLLGLLLMIFLSSLATAPADAATLPAYAACPWLHLKSSGSCVRRLQNQLNDDHVSPHLTVDGVFGKQTLQAVKNFQRRKGLRPDGVVGPQTALALQPDPRPARTPASRPSKYSRFLHSARGFWSDIWRHMSPPVIAICAIIFVTFGAAALFGVRRVRIRYSKRTFECDVERFPPQRIVNAQADVINKYIDLQARYPDRLPPPDDPIRGIGRGSW